MSKKTTDEIFATDFPALFMAVIIDARYSSRQELLKDLKATALFENIVEAKSLSDGLKLLASEAVDVCLLGPSLNVANVARFIEQGTASEKSKDCAFVALNQNDPQRAGELSACGAQRVLHLPASKRQLSEEIVRAVIAANKNSPWSSILLNAEGEQDDSPGLSLVPAKSAAEELSIKEIPEDLSDLLRSLESSQSDFKPESYRQSGKAKALAQLLLNSLLTKVDIETTSSAFKTFMEEAALEWLEDAKLYSPRDATAELRKKLKSFREPAPN